FLSTPTPTFVSSSLSLHDALPILKTAFQKFLYPLKPIMKFWASLTVNIPKKIFLHSSTCGYFPPLPLFLLLKFNKYVQTFKKRKDRKSTRLNSSHVKISYAVFCLK